MLNSRNSLARLCLGVLLLLVLPLSAAATNDTQGPEYVLWVGGNAPGRAQREVEVITAALERTRAEFGPYQLAVSSEPLAAGTWRQQLTEGERIHIVPTPYLDFPEEDLTLIPVPISGGLLGYRNLVVRRDRLEEFSGIDDAAGLRHKEAGQGRDWPDMWVYEANGLPVTGAEDLPQLVAMLEAGDIDYLPLGVEESESIIQKFANDPQSLSIVPNLLIYYPLSSFPVVTNKKPQLIERLSAGLEAMHTDGTLRLEDLSDRRHPQRPLCQVIKLENPSRLFPVL